MGVKVEAAAYSSIGGRKNNEDNFYLDGIFLKREQMDQGGKVSLLNAHPAQVYAVFDGMGGGDYGEFASACAAEALKRYQAESTSPDDPEALLRFLTETSQQIDRFSLERALQSGACGSTAAILILGDRWCRAVNVGDSRIYLLREGTLARLTRDQSEVQRLVDAGEITPDEAWSHPRKNIITHHLGMPLKGDLLEAVIGERMELREGDCFLICSDGVSDNLRDEEIREALDSRGSAEELASGIVRRTERSANERDVESDNVTAVVLKVQRVGGDGVLRRARRWLTGHRLAAICAALVAAGIDAFPVRLR